INQQLQLTFDQNISKGSSGRFYIYNENGTEFTSFATSNANATTSGTTLYVNHNDFVEGAIYYITIDPGFIVSQATSLAFQGISDVNQWRFTTVIPAPEITTYLPVQDATDVTASQSLILTFDQNIQFGATGPRLYINNADN
ncbi:hypothetical protein, partial [Carboxylicivirga caseinilyticus]|uniref:hypothetical protein n=1 Tax=Carboxylicivirga caseinilyticus TaxID=3417572 RepID=UPI003D3440A2|nr:Ig-like domain-containing protein [Marinilabiliaceae bacterium A049]